jgi:hypothetical protein
MTQYFFDICDDDNLTTDEEGMEFLNIEAAQEEALAAPAMTTRGRF